ncbi:hypothetical protein QF026_001466 [Streptomyces aurantiacus]|uniref:hypothetical protein n=1 Tax=Streptomyces aurantiacus TaxID=47760 RepID=UPI002791243B|nr:hypothetical protein [Streptomyces aurantiacus]MDQ0773000.1 hypothetical protein [Streptomyces aurantiacus]
MPAPDGISTQSLFLQERQARLGIAWGKTPDGLFWRLTDIHTPLGGAEHHAT